MAERKRAHMSRAMLFSVVVLVFCAHVGCVHDPSYLDHLLETEKMPLDHQIQSTRIKHALLHRLAAYQDSLEPALFLYSMACMTLRAGLYDDALNLLESAETKCTNKQCLGMIQTRMDDGYFLKRLAEGDEVVLAGKRAADGSIDYGIDEIIGPQISSNQAFGKAMECVIKLDPPYTVLETGASGGSGSTAVLANALDKQSQPKLMFSIEVSLARWEAMSALYEEKGYEWLHFYHSSSVLMSEFPSLDDVSDFLLSSYSLLSFLPLRSILSWLKADVEYVEVNNVPQGAIDQIKSDFNFTNFDFVLLDSSEFAGHAELAHVLGSKWILLDDSSVFKNFRTHADLLANPDYILQYGDPFDRNGYSVFRNIHSTPDVDIAACVAKKRQ